MFELTWERCSDDHGVLRPDDVRIVLYSHCPRRIVSIAESHIDNVDRAIHAVVCEVPAPQRNQIRPAFDTGDLDSAEYIQAVWDHGFNMRESDAIFKDGGSLDDR